MRLAALLLCACLAAVAQTPVIQAVFNQATMAAPVAPGVPILVNGTNLAAGVTDCHGPNIPTICGSVSVTVDGRAVPVRLSYPTQVLTYVPTDQRTGIASVVVKNHQGLTSAPFAVAVEQYAPGIQRLGDASGTMLGFFSDAYERVIGRANPASAGQEVTAYAVGLGPTNPPVPAGETGTAPATTPLTVLVGGRSVPVLSAGLGCGVLCEPGTYLVRFALPQDTASGDQPVIIDVGGKRSPAAILVVGPPSSGPAVGYLQSVLDAKARAMSPGMVANVVGGGFTPGPGGLNQCSLDPSVWPTTCQGVTVTINNRRAAISALSSNMITIQIPFELNPGPAALTVERTAGSQTLKSAPFNFQLDLVSPTLAADPQSMYAGVAIQNSGGVATKTNPLLPGDNIFIYASGLGQTNPPMVTGFGLLQPAPTVLMPSVTVGGKPLANVVADVQPQTIGQYRVSATVPQGLGTGDLPIILEIGGAKSQAGLLVPVSNTPVISAVTNAASGAIEMASGAWLSIYGRNLAKTSRQWTESDILYDWLPTDLEGTHVTINDTKAVVAFVSPTQLNVLAPDGLPPGPVDVIVESPLGWQKTTGVVKPYAPGLFTLPIPPGTYISALHTDWAYVAQPGMMPWSSSVRPAKPGETIIFFGTGFGPTNPQASIYHRFSGSAPLAGPVQPAVRIGSVPATIGYVGLVGNGLYQMNVVVPDLPDGDHEVVVTMGAESSPRGRYIPIRR
jgi:uncharacterized protein (TIGR03437 family)